MPREFPFTRELPELDEAAAYNHDRPISSLIRTQLLHLHTAENLHLKPSDRTNININHLLTERQASEYIQKVTALLHEHGKAAAKQKPVTAGESNTEKKKRKIAAGASSSKTPGTKTSSSKGKSPK